MARIKSKQLKLGEEERKALSLSIRDDWSLDSRDMENRNKAYKRWYKLWRAADASAEFPAEDVSNFHIPLTQWNVLTKLAKEIDALLGDDSEVMARPVGPSDAKKAPVVARYMNWRVKISLKLFEKLYDYLLQKGVLGTSIAFLGWARRERQVIRLVEEEKQEEFTAIDEITGLEFPSTRTVKKLVRREETVVDFEGPELKVENIEDWAIPPMARTIDEADHLERRLRLTVDELLQMADDGFLDKEVLSGDNLHKLRRFAETGQVSDITDTDAGKIVRDEKQEQKGLPPPGSEEGRDEHLTVINWIGKWRSPEAADDKLAEDVVAYYQPETALLLGASRLVDQFPDGRRPFIKSVLVKDINSFFGIGLPELLESINKEMDVQHNALTDASVYSLGPIIVYEPTSGFDPRTFKYEPFMTVPVANANGVKALNLSNISMAPYVALQPQLLGYAERVSGLTEAEMGRPFNQPNAPRTLGQQQIIQASSSVRMLLDLRLERESLRTLLHRIWEMDKLLLPEPLFFRVTEDADFEQLTREELEGEYDFDIGPLTSTANRQQETMFLLQAYALNLQNPVAAQNPAILGAYLKKINERLGQADINAFLPDFEKMAPPQTPEQENARIFQGEDVDPHPMDNHNLHIAKHGDFRERMSSFELIPGSGITVASRSPGLIGRIDAHIAEHEQAVRTGMARIPGMTAMPQMGGMGGGGQSVAPPATSDTTGQPNDPLNALKGMLNSGGQNLA